MSAVTLLRSLGLVARATSAPISGVVGPSDVRFATLLKVKPGVDEVIAEWRAALDVRLSVAEAVLFEAILSSAPGPIARALPASMTYLKTLHTARERAAIAIHDFARDVNWRRPVLFVRSLRVARGYLRSVVGHADLSPERFRKEFTGRLGVETVLISRFDAISTEDVEEAINSLCLSITQGNDPATAVPYLLEAAVARFDLQPDPQQLMSVMKVAAEYLPNAVDHPAVQLAMCDAYLRLASSAGSRARVVALSRASDCVDGVLKSAEMDDDQVRALMLQTVIAAAVADPELLNGEATVGLRMPFGLRGVKSSRLFGLLAAELTESIIHRAERGDLLARGVCADLLALGRGGPDAGLRRIIELRQGSSLQRGLSDDRSVLLGLRDSLVLASLEGSVVSRGIAVSSLVNLALANPTSPAPLLLLAQDAEANGAVLPLGRVVEGGQALVLMLKAGDWPGLLAMAAERALASTDLAETPLGGRSGVTTVGDYHGFVGQTFTIKAMPRIALEREKSRLDSLSVAVDKRGRGSGLRLPQHVAEFEQDAGGVLSVRRFVPGRPVREVAVEGSAKERIGLLVRVAEFLALMNNFEHASEDGVRKELKQKEVGRWLRAIGEERPLETFDAWWELVSSVPVVARRDAHLDNWVLTEDDSILAIDLEAVGSRPLSYELAQITDDAAVFEATDWTSRRSVFANFREALSDELKISSERLWAAYQASVAARALRRLTWDDSRPEDQAHAQATLHWLAEHAGRPELRDWTVGVLATWTRARGVSDLGPSDLVMDDHRRRRISKAMAYHLRHGEAVEIDDEGWASIPELASAIASGVSEREIAIVASTLSDPRFEFRNRLVRARYGHSRSAPGLAASATWSMPVTRVFHATTLRGAKAVLDGREGLLPMSRMFVHLSRSASESLRSGHRHGYPLLLSTDSTRVADLMARGGDTFVAAKVSVHQLSVESVSSHWSLLPPVEWP